MTPILGIWASQNYPRVTTSFESIATVSVGSGGAADVTFSSIPSTYKHLQIRAIARVSVAQAFNDVKAQFNSDTGSNYARHGLGGDGSAVYAYADTSQTSASVGIWMAANSATSNIFGSFICDILDYQDTNKYKVTRSLSGSDQNGSGLFGLWSTVWMNTAAITSIKLFNPSNNLMQYSHFALYGIKGA